MSSTNKTSLGFNQWILEDKPRMEDFNSDNALVDEKLVSANQRIEAVETSLGNKANLNSPALTGVPTINGSKISIIEPPTWYDLPLTDDVQTYHASTKTAYCKNYFGMVYITFYIKRTNSRVVLPLMQDSHKPKVPLFGTLGLFALQAQVL